MTMMMTAIEPKRPKFINIKSAIIILVLISIGVVHWFETQPKPEPEPTTAWEMTKQIVLVPIELNDDDICYQYIDGEMVPHRYGDLKNITLTIRFWSDSK